jgi:hypothetical protein
LAYRPERLAIESNMNPQITQRMANMIDKGRRALHFLKDWIAAPSVPKPISEQGRVNDPRRPEL